MDQVLRNQISSIIDDVDDMTIATIRDDGYPQATTVSYVSDGLDIYFITSAQSQKVCNIEKDNRVSVTIDRPYKDWNEIESISMAATADIVSSPEEQASTDKLFLKKFPEAANFEPEEPGEVAYIRLKPTWVSVLDYKKGFGHTELVNADS